MLILVLLASGTFVRWQARKLGRAAGVKVRSAIQHKVDTMQHASARLQAPHTGQPVAGASVSAQTAVKANDPAKAPAAALQAPKTAVAPATPAGSVARSAQADAGFQDADLGILKPTASQYAYNPDNRRDPFQTLLNGDFTMEQGENGRPLVDIGDLELRGVMAGNNELYAMVEDSKHHGFTLRVGDPVLNGRVTHVASDCVTFNLSSYGENQTVRLRLKPQSLNGK